MRCLTDMRPCSMQAAAVSTAAQEGPKKPPGEIIRYHRDFLLKFMDVSAGCCPLQRRGGLGGP